MKAPPENGYAWSSFPHAITSLALLIIVIGFSLGQAYGRPEDHGLSQLQARNAKLPIEVRGHSFILHTYLPTKLTAANRPVVLYLSGASGWHAFDDHIASTMARHGAAVYGLSVHSYLTTFYNSHHPATTEELSRDCWLFANEIRHLADIGEGRIVIGGWSLGAGYALLTAANPQVRPLLKGVICVAISRQNESFYSLVDTLKSKVGLPARGPFLDVAQALRDGVPPVAILQAEGDKSASPTEARSLVSLANLNTGTTRLLIVKGASNHRFEGARREFDVTLTQALDWIDTANKL